MLMRHQSRRFVESKETIVHAVTFGQYLILETQTSCMQVVMHLICFPLPLLPGGVLHIAWHKYAVNPRHTSAAWHSPTEEANT